MSTTVNTNSSYAGEHAGKYIAASILTANTLAQGAIEVKPNIKFREVVSKIALDDILADGSCDFTATSTLDKTERVLQPKEMQVNLQVCKKSLRNDWEAIEMGMGVMDDQMPKTFEDFLVGHVAEKTQAAIEQNIWNGTDTAGSFAGFKALLSVDADLPSAQELAGTTVDATNVIDELGDVVTAIPASLYGKEDLYIYISQNVYRAYVRALGALGFMDRFNNQGLGDLMFDGVKLFVANGLPNDTMIAAEKSNLFFGTGLMSESNEVSILDMSQTDGSQNYRYIMRFTAGVQYGSVEDIVTYGIVNSAN